MVDEIRIKRIRSELELLKVYSSTNRFTIKDQTIESNGILPFTIDVSY